MRNGRIAICLLAVATLACQFLTKTLESPATQLPATAVPATPSYVPTEQTSTPQALLSQNGPWIVFSGSDGLYAANLDGSAATKVFDLAPYLKLDPTPYIKLSSIARTGGRFAIVTANDYTGTYGLTLRIIHLPDGKEEKTIPLTGPQSEPAPNFPLDDPRRYPLQDYGTSQWSADGTQLAFEAGIDGDSADLYLYSTAKGSVRRITSGSAQDYAPNWSPDGKYIVHFGTDSWGTGAGYHMVGVWATLMSKDSTYDLYTPNSRGEDVLGWLDDQTVILYSFFANCSTENIRAVNVSTRKKTPLWKGAFNPGQIAFDPASGAFVLQTDDFSSYNDCPQDGKSAGGYLVTRDGTATKISDSTSGFPVWSAEAGVFFYPKGEVFAAVRPDGISFTTPAGLDISPIVAPDGKAYVWQNAKGGIDLFLNGTTQTLTNLQPATPNSPLDLTGYSESALPSMIWNHDSTGFIFTSGQELYAAQAEKKFAPVAIATMSSGNIENLLFRVSP